MRALVVLLAPLLCALAASSAFAAGDVNVVLARRGQLQLTGDELGNDLQIDRDPDTKEFVVLAFGGFNLKAGINADLGAGNDTLSLYNMVIVGRVIVHGGDGDDTITVAAGCDLRSGGYLGGDEGANHVAITDSYVRGPMRILTGSDADLVEIHRNGFTSKASLSVRTGSGDDVVDYLGNTFQCPVETLTSMGVDTLNVKTSRFVKAVGMNCGDGDDVVNIERCTFDARFFISGGAGTNKASAVGGVFTNGGLLFAGGYGHSGHFYWAFIIINVF